jgi:aminopeptidase N
MPNFRCASIWSDCALLDYQMKKILLFLVLASLPLVHASAHNFCAEARQQHNASHAAAKTAIASPLLELYDVKYVKLDLSMTNLNDSIGGNAITRAVVSSSAGMSSYVFELSNSLTIDSLKFNGTLYTATTLSADVKQVSLPSTLSQGTSFTVQVFYHGIPPNGTGFFTHALNHHALASGTNITYTLSDRDLSKEWWPCKQILTDKIDSADLWFTVPAGTKAGSNGLLKAVTPVGTRFRYEWKTRYPIDYYLICASVAPYIERSQVAHFTGSTDSMLVQHYLYDTATMPVANSQAIDSTPYMIDYLSTLYGRYPFWQEKYGHCIAPLGGGMEHQTMTTLGAFTTPLIAHELGHQWWGDHVTYTSWADIWLSEGFAAYTEQLYVEHFWGIPAAQAYRTTVFNRVSGNIGGSVYVDDTTNVYRVFDSRLTYDKGAAVAHMLRYIAPSDAAYFSGLRAYQQRYAFRTAITDSLKVEMETAYGRRLDTFFNQWVYGEGYPIYSGSWNQKGSDVYIQLNQVTSKPASVAAFAMPIELKLKSASGDTIVKVYFNNAQQLYSFNWGRQMTGFMIDSANHIVNKLGSIIADPTLGVSNPAAQSITIAPNPTSEGWKLSGIPQGSSLRLLDAGGRLVWQQNNAPRSIEINSSQLPAGIYTLQVQSTGSAATAYKLQRR